MTSDYFGEGGEYTTMPIKNNTLNANVEGLKKYSIFASF